MLYMVSWGQFSGSLEFTEGWGFFALSVSLNRFQSLIFHAWVARLNEQICYQLQGVWAYSCWLITLCKHTHTHTSVPGLASLCLSSSGIPGWNFVWRSLYPGTHFSQRLPHACATDPGFDEQHWAAVLDFASWRHRRVLCPRVKS